MVIGPWLASYAFALHGKESFDRFRPAAERSRCRATLFRVTAMAARGLRGSWLSANGRGGFGALHGAPSAVGALKIACKGLISQERFGPSFEGKRYEIK